MTRVGLLHTVTVLPAVFDELLQPSRSGLEIVHVADPTLLERTVDAGEVTPDVEADIRRHLEALRDGGAAAVLVTCSSIGEAAESAARAAGVRLMRVDEAMAREAAARAAVAADRRITILATLGTTLGPTARLVERFTDPGVGVTARVVPDAGAARARGDHAEHDRLVAEAIAAEDAEVIVLAQASMAAGAGEDPRVLTSPRTGAASFLTALRGER
ncbi:aspartate/glutamate racemase family protein [Agromyces mediolanus]|uniref:aspartate/glutamate racemase family protein n=1 Tax=Agromyces mediolanus TaxID=41986 RepID=UPI00203B554D|nr:aspartate/glutamate racemase family protein [Agromyces mediolanus]MCM3658263.1 aspartate/glutamate racemase family protein [Agromyces mediolanus]